MPVRHDRLLPALPTRRRVWPSLLSHRQRRRIVVPKRQSPGEPALHEPVVDEAAQQRAREIEQELQLARDIQQGLLLEAAPHLPGWEVTAISLPARDLGGDLYDFLPLANGLHGIMIGDVSGKGLPAALRMAVARTVFRHEARRYADPASTIAAVNRGILSEIPHGMVTMLYLHLEPHTGAVRCANAGHTFPLLITDTIQELEISGLPLGVDSESEYTELNAVIAPGESLLLYTDGLIEATRADGAILGFERLVELIMVQPQRKPRALAAALVQEVRTWTNGVLSDDVTLVILRRRLLDLAAEMRSVIVDVIGSEAMHTLWATAFADGVPATVEAWRERLPQLQSLAQAQFGRGLARELLQQIRLTLDDYREHV
ncbi:MAG TPA: serine/threonine-protein phosphatase [Chloroflexus aurantiacus]|uniref:Stage II sporulation E family protein n=2 Tax=Chloroflexus TaxID=1107 RepID=A9WBT2_CHLAA|nr:PP2C family protein-serine/threonine phosphatase [Chloroflexus aurantiacus]ABY34889.1 Stage II sporulation E family protein [Chloroflexus aurantiacus J-10-fl]RMG46911.1 MAG: serine/threonine-protein phosphatase [Chloroflexota bacterium]GIV92765.1 MAG: stage II sporulation protein E [Chloroflexus sp.]HBW69023.1 serine/threonine-protein phosphatase [Chloroflexus aurantiacus]